MRAENRAWLTPDAYEQLRAELATLTRQQSPHIREQEIAGVVESDPDDVTDAQHCKTRVRQIQWLLNSAVVGEAPPDDGIAERAWC